MHSSLKWCRATSQCMDSFANIDWNDSLDDKKNGPSEAGRKAFDTKAHCDAKEIGVHVREDWRLRYLTSFIS